MTKESLPKIDFYVLSNANKQSAMHFACGLIAKHYQNQRQVYVHVQTRLDAEQFEKLLWIYQEDAFIPHHIYINEETPAAPIQIGFGAPPQKQRDYLLNLTQEVPGFFSQFAQLIEIVYADPLIQQLARDRFRYYRTHACEIITHKLDHELI